VEHDDLTDAGLENLVKPSGDGSQVEVAYRATRVPAKLQVHYRVAIGYGHGLTVDAHQYTRLEDIPGADFAVRVKRDHGAANFYQRFIFVHALSTTQGGKL
jgi:hypothetical protein